MKGFLGAAAFLAVVFSAGCGKPSKPQVRADAERKVDQAMSSLSSTLASSSVTFSLDPSKSAEMVNAAQTSADAANKMGAEIQGAMDAADQAK